MNRFTTAALQNPAGYDECLVFCLKKMFIRSAKDKVEPGFKISDNIGELEEELKYLNDSCPIELSPAYLAAMERSIPGSGFRYAIIYKQNRPVLFTYFQLFTLTSRNFSFENNKGFVKGIFRFFIDLKKIKVLISGNALRTETACYCFDKNALNKEEAAELIASVAEKIADDEKATALVLKDMPVSTHAVKWLEGKDYHTPWEDKVMVMDIDSRWTALQDYVAVLSRKYKTRANKILAAGSRLITKEFTEQDIVTNEKEINLLFKKVVDNQSFFLIQPLHDHFSQLKKVYKNDFTILGFYDGDKLVAFYSAFISENTYELYYAGFDYEHNGEYQLYFNILFTGLEQAILLKKKQLKLGRTSFDAKASMGAKAIGMPYFLKTPNIPDVVINWFANYFSSLEDNKWMQRNPLK